MTGTSTDRQILGSLDWTPKCTCSPLGAACENAATWHFLKPCCQVSGFACDKCYARVVCRMHVTHCWNCGRFPQVPNTWWLL